MSSPAEKLIRICENSFSEGYRRGFEAAKAAAAQLVMIERHIAEDTGDDCDLSHLEDQIEQLQPEVTR